MKRSWIVLLCVFFMFSLFATGQETVDPTADILALENAWVAAELHNDSAALDKLLSSSIVISQPDGSIQSKAETLAYVGDKSNHWDTVVSENMKVHMYGNVGVVTGTYHEKGTSAGKPFDNHGFFTDTWIRRDGKWICIAGHDSYAVKG